MGKFSEMDIMGDTLPLSDSELNDLQIQCALADLRELRGRLIRVEDRVKYHGESVSAETLTQIIKEIGRIIKLLN